MFTNRTRGGTVSTYLKAKELEALDKHLEDKDLATAAFVKVAILEKLQREGALKKKGGGK